jgi:Zn finger protein HypA/HybF involved in hydrogenase expression
MGEGIRRICSHCKSGMPPEKYTRGGFKDYIKGVSFIGRGVECHEALLPGYCNTCQKFVSQKAEKPFCEKCQSLILFHGEFALKHSSCKNDSQSSYTFYYPIGFLNENPFGLRLDDLIENSNISDYHKNLFKINPDIIDEFDIVFTIDFTKKYFCPNCGTFNLKLYPELMMWD